MSEVRLYGNIIIAILAVSYPIIIQVISRLDDKYGSEEIVKRFKQEPIMKRFQFLLIASLISLFIWSLKLPPLPPFDNLGFIVDNSSNLLVMLMTVLLVVSFINLVNKVLTYSDTSKLFDYINSKK